MTVPVVAYHFSPANQLTHEVRELAAEIHGTPAWAHFPRWYRSGGSLWLESSSGSRTLTVDFDRGVIRLPEWTRSGERERQIPDSWLELYRGSLFHRDGSAIDPEAFAAASAQDGWKAARL